MEPHFCKPHHQSNFTEPFRYTKLEENS